MKLAFIAPLTGDEAVVGVPMMRATALAVDEANSAADLPFRVELLAVNDEARPARARELAQTMVADPMVFGVVGHKNSGPSFAAGAVYAAGNLPQVSPSSTNSDLARQGWDTFFRVCADNDRQATVAARYALDSLGVQRVAIVHDQTDYGWPLAETFMVEIQDGGAEVVHVEAIKLGQTVFDATVQRLKSIPCDLIYFGLTEIESAILVGSLRSAGVGTDCFGADGGSQSPFPDLAGEPAEGVYETYAGVDAETSIPAATFVEKFTSLYGHCPIFGPEAYDAACILLEALRRADSSDRRSLLAEVRSLEKFEGATGKLDFEPNGNRRDAVVTIWQVIGGKMTLLA